MKVYDITRRLSAETEVWPGDEPVQLGWTARMEEGATVNIGRLSMSTHAGTHLDAPLHFLKGGRSVDHLAVERFLGPVIIIDVDGASEIRVDHLDALMDGDIRILFKSSCSRGPDAAFSKEFPHVSPNVIDELGRRGVVLIGTDAPSVDPFTSTELPAHHALARHGIVNLEGLQLRGVEPGRYELIALPLKLEGLDAAPVRAILVDRGE